MKRTLESINEKILAAYKMRSADLAAACGQQLPLLIAVSKLKPTSSIIEAYEAGQRHFGENYIQELVEKSNSVEILDKCPDIKFHFIGHLQSNKCSKLRKVKNLHMVQSVDSVKLADLINKAFAMEHQNFGSGSDDDQTSSNEKVVPSDSRLADKLKVMIQVNTSGEEAKSGIEPDHACQLALHIRDKCKKLDLSGLMTIGKLDGWGDQPNQDFLKLFQVRKEVAHCLNVPQSELKLSMGMSGDYEDAITMGSSMVRVGTLIFGQRPTK